MEMGKGNWGEKGKDQSKDEAGAGIHPTFDTAAARAKSPALRRAPDIIAEGYVAVMVGAWMEKWMGWGSGVGQEMSDR